MARFPGIVDEVNKNPNLWSQRHKLEGFDVDNIEEYEELEDDERDALENILTDPRKCKLFTTAKSLQRYNRKPAKLRSCTKWLKVYTTENRKKRS